MAKHIWPVPGYSTITSGVGARWGSTHKGIDIAAPRGTEVVASSGGTVIDVVNSCTHNYGKTKETMSSDTCGGGYGNRVYIKHPDGFVTRYTHLTSVSVKVNDRVTQGQVIGTVGSTGQSTGFHLHYEIREKSGNYLDPEIYVNPSNNINESIDSVQGSTQKVAGKSDMPQVYTNDSIIGTSVIVTGTQSSVNSMLKSPLHAYFRLSINGEVITFDNSNARPHIFQSLEVSKYDDKSFSAQFVLFDDYWDVLEEKLAASFNNIGLEYGWVDGPHTETVKMLLQDYTVDISNEEGTILHIKAVSDPTYDNLQPITLDTGTKNPTEAVKKICQFLGYKVIDKNFVETVTVEDRGGNFKLAEDQPITYIMNTIIPESITPSIDLTPSGGNGMPSEVAEVMSGKEGSLVFYVDPATSEDGRPVPHFVPRGYSSDGTLLRTYIYHRGRDSEVESLSFDVKGMFGGTTNFLTASGLRGVHINQSSKNEDAQKKDQTDVTTSNQDSNYTIPNDQSQPVENYARDSRTQVIHKLYSRLKNKSTEQYEATMTIIGDPTFKLLDNVKIIVLTDTEIEGEYTIYHTSGIYQVHGVIDTIENGSYKTTLKLVHSGNLGTVTIV